MYWCYYPHTPRDSVSPICGIFVVCFYNQTNSAIPIPTLLYCRLPVTWQSADSWSIKSRYYFNLPPVRQCPEYRVEGKVVMSLSGNYQYFCFSIDNRKCKIWFCTIIIDGILINFVILHLLKTLCL